MTAFASDFFDIVGKENYYFRYWIGNFLTLITIGYIEYCHQTGLPVVTPFSLLMFAIVVATSTGGLRLGLVSTTLVSIYTLYANITHFGPSTITGSYFKSFVGITIFYSQAIILGVIKEKKDKTIIQLEDTRQELHNEVEDREIKLQEALEKALIIERGNTLGKFATGISHDFNNILQSIMSLSELTLYEVNNPIQVTEFQKNIIKQSEFGAKLIQQIMDFSRKSRITEEIFDLNSFLTDFTKNARRLVPKQIDINYHQYEHPVYIQFDPIHLNQIFMNIIVNAKDAIDGHGTITILLEDHSDDNSVLLSIIDTGSGIPEDILPHIFEPYFTTKNRSEGTGLGLAQVWGLVQQHDGSIVVKSKVNEGTIFVITVPKSHTREIPDIQYISN